MAGKAIA